MSCTLTVPDYLGEGIQANPNWPRSFIKTLEKHDSGVADFEIIGLVISDGNWYQMVVHEGRSTQASSVKGFHTGNSYGHPTVFDLCK